MIDSCHSQAAKDPEGLAVLTECMDDLVDRGDVDVFSYTHEKVAHIIRAIEASGGDGDGE